LSPFRNFVREDRKRQGSQQQTRDNDLEQKLFEAIQSATNELNDGKGRKITLKKPQADLLQRLQHQKELKLLNHETSDSFVAQSSSLDNTPFLSTNREGVVQSRLIRFGTSSPHNSRESSPAPLSDKSTSDSTLISTNSANEADLSQKLQLNEKTVFGISTKSSSLSR